MISIESQHKLLLQIAGKLKKQITAYAIGGTAMMFLGLKDSTLDIDLVFESIKDRDLFKKAIEKLGYTKMNSIEVYGAKRNHPEMFTRGDERFDLFVKDVIDFVFTTEMQKRSDMIKQFKENLILKISNPHDIILMKCATERQKDKDDARTIIENTAIDWDIIIKEAENQVKLGKDRAVFDLGCFLEDIKQMKVTIPQEVLNKLFKSAEKQAKEKIKQNKF